MDIQSLKQLYHRVRSSLAGAGIDTAALDARILIKVTFQVDDADFITDRKLSVSQADYDLLGKRLERRKAHEPVTRILEQTQFWGLPFQVTPDVLDPRPDTETVMEIAVSRFDADARISILDLGTGSGCLLVALLHQFQNAEGVGIDVSDKALEVARNNARLNGVERRASFQKGNWAEGIQQSFDLIVSNPPYIDSPAIANLDASVRKYDPILALDGGKDGFDCYKIIFSQIKNILKTDGTGLFEIGIGQAENTMRIVKDSGLSVKGVHPDIAGIPRVVEISFGEK